MELKDFRRPPNDTGVCFHGTAANTQGSDVGLQVRLATEAKAMGATWYKLLDPSYETTQALLAMGVEPVARMFIDRPGGKEYQAPDCQDARGKQKRFILGGGKWVEAYWNEVNNNNENQNNVILHPAKIAEQWVVWVRETVDAGGWPSTPSLSQGGVWEDLAYIETFMQEVKRLDPGVLQLPIWAGVHSYCLNHPPTYKATTGYDAGRYLYPDWRSSFLGWQLVAEVIFRHVGRQVPVILTEGGVVIGAHDDPTFPTVSEQLHRDWCVEMVEYMRTAPKCLFGGIGFWLISNEEAGFFDGAWSSAAFLRLGEPGYLLAVPALKGTPRVNRARVWEENPVATEQERIDAAKQRLREMFEDKVLNTPLVAGDADRIEVCEAWFNADQMAVVTSALEGWGMGSAGFAVTTEGLDRVGQSARGALASLLAVAKNG